MPCPKAVGITPKQPGTAVSSFRQRESNSFGHNIIVFLPFVCPSMVAPKTSQRSLSCVLFLCVLFCPPSSSLFAPTHASEHAEHTIHPCSQKTKTRHRSVSVLVSVLLPFSVSGRHAPTPAHSAGWQRSARSGGVAPALPPHSRNRVHGANVDSIRFDSIRLP